MSELAYLSISSMSSSIFSLTYPSSSNKSESIIDESSFSLVSSISSMLSSALSFISTLLSAKYSNKFSISISDNSK